MKINSDALKALELKLAEYSKANGTIAEHDSANNNSYDVCRATCKGSCFGNCLGSCAVGCTGGNITSPPQSPKY
ncbi:MAG: hypothetical protein IKP64_07440 [Selenomonadaceae bacterium]|nr:hypothetical protein [Selenomonadaceae bacterium]